MRRIFLSVYKFLDDNIHIFILTKKKLLIQNQKKKKISDRGF